MFELRSTAVALAVLLLAPAGASADQDPQQLLLRDLDRSLGTFDATACGAAGSFGSAAVFLGAGAAVAANTDKGVRSTWAVILLDIGTVSALDGLLLLAIPDDGGACAKRYGAMPKSSPEERAARISAGQACLKEAASANGTYRWASAGTRLAVAGGVVGLWATDPPEPHDTTILVIGGLTAVGAVLGVLFEGNSEKQWDQHQQLVQQLSATGTVLRDEHGSLVPGLSVAAAF